MLQHLAERAMGAVNLTVDVGEAAGAAQGVTPWGAADWIGKVGVPVVISAIVIVFLWKFGAIILSMLKQKLLAPPKDAVGASSGLQKAVQLPGRQPKPDTDAHRRRVPLMDHTLFATISGLQGINVKRVTCGCPARTAVLKTMLTGYLEIWHRKMKEFVSSQLNGDDFDAHGTEFAVTLEAKVTKLLIDIQDEIRERWSKDDIPVQAVTAFDRWHSAVIELLVDHAQRNASSPFYPSNRERLVAVMSQCELALSIVVVEAKLTLKRMNGSLDGLYFQGAQIQPIAEYPSMQFKAVEPDTDVPMNTPLPGQPPLAKKQEDRNKRRSGEHKARPPSDDDSGH